MTRRATVALAGLLAIAPGFALAQAPDPAAERARLANERIQAESERRAQEELALRNRAAETAMATRAEPPRPPSADSPPSPRPPPADADRTGRALEQLRELGRLKDAGYLTEAEFQRVKQRILDEHF